VYKVMAKVDCGIFPSRAEGWNLELLEMISCGKNVITTNYSAHTEFCSPENSFLVNIENTESAFDGKWFNGKIGNWASISKKEIDCFVEYMRHVHSAKPTNSNGHETGKKFSWLNSARSILKYV